MVASVMTFPEHGIVVSVTSNISYADTFAVALKIAQAFAEGARFSGVLHSSQGGDSSPAPESVLARRSLSERPGQRHS